MTKFLDDNWLADRDIIQIQASAIRHHPDPGEYNQTPSRSRRIQSDTIQIQASTIRHHPDPGECNQAPSRSRHVQLVHHPNPGESVVRGEEFIKVGCHCEKEKVILLYCRTKLLVCKKKLAVTVRRRKSLIQYRTKSSYWPMAIIGSTGQKGAGCPCEKERVIFGSAGLKLHVFRKELATPERR